MGSVEQRFIVYVEHIWELIKEPLSQPGLFWEVY
jgi:hypothetical protein